MRMGVEKRTGASSGMITRGSISARASSHCTSWVNFPHMTG
jgi:hypothetical protein